MIQWLFRTLFPVSGGPVCFLQSAPLFKQNKDISSCLRDEILMTGATSAALARGVSDRHFERGEGPGDDVGLRSQILSTRKG